ncbi:hypothetical protein CAPTEDRAFT_189999 [Capitella teleta]|uniref:Uncharacterized protein n=1 Tax=Capitella teleta TaxID=283909 RepID=R7T7N4_CAPTE|nr:hypothetical protein CAPTEDRAFT_189999 [Capitella teleta]|eukprot:ELT87430.1 hypothetical protein CAPTEDRAFT_189999 [Capitella teleta]
MKKKCISSVLHRQLGVEDGLPLQTSQSVAKSVKVKMHTMLKSKKGVLYSGCVAALSSFDALNEEGPGIQQTEESTEATEQPSHSSDNLQDPDHVFTFTAASVEDDVKRMPKEIRALLAFEIAKAERQEIIHKAHDLTTKTDSLHRREHSSNCSLEFDWVWLQPGPGHIEMNMLRSFVKMMWEPFWGEVVEIFNFKSENAKRAARNVTDHHKGMAMASIIRDAMAMELVIPYVRKELEGGHPEISVAGYMNYVMKVVKSETCAFIADAVFEFLDAIFAYRSGVRCGHTDLMDAGMHLFAPIWSSRAHPHYRVLDAYDSLFRSCMPPAVRDHIDVTRSISLTGSRYSGEGADFKMEEVNVAYSDRFQQCHMMRTGFVHA